MKFLALLACFGFIALALSGQRAEACSCPLVGKVVSKQRAQEFNGALFYGKVTDVSELRHYSADGKSYSLEYVVTFDVERIWKGADATEIKVKTDPSPSCGISYAIGKKYLVLAQELNGSLRASRCVSPTEPSQLSEVVNEHGEGRLPEVKEVPRRKAKHNKAMHPTRNQ